MSKSWLSGAEHVQMSFRSMKPFYFTSSTIMILYCTAALYIDPIYYNTTLYSTLSFTFSSPQYNNTTPVNVLSVFVSLVGLTLIGK